jgi:hypothetical protein
MSERRRTVNEQHPLFPEYIRKCRELAAELDREWDKLPIGPGLDGPSVALCKEYSGKIEELKKEYDFLFTEEEK